MGQAYGVSPHAIVKTVTREKYLTPAKIVRGRRLYDPAKVAPRVDGRHSPVDTGHPVTQQPPTKRAVYLEVGAGPPTGVAASTADAQRRCKRFAADFVAFGPP